MSQIKNLATVPEEEAKQFIDSIDYVFSDLDGVLLLAASPLPGAASCIDKLKELGKKVAFVTNNTISSFKMVKEELNHLKAADHEIVTPVHCIIAHLQKINCPKDIYCIGGHVLRDSLTEAGYNIIKIKDGTLKESMQELKNVCFEFLDESKNVGAIVMDLDVNFKLIHAEGAILLLTRNPNMPFICAAVDECGPITGEIELIGNKFYVEAIERITKKQCTILAKPSIKLKEYLEDRYKIENNRKVLFIGDSLTSDICFANRANYQSLLVLTGQTKLDDLVDWKHDDICYPSYYIESLESLTILLNKWYIKYFTCLVY